MRLCAVRWSDEVDGSPRLFLGVVPRVFSLPILSPSFFSRRPPFSLSLSLSHITLFSAYILAFMRFLVPSSESHRIHSSVGKHAGIGISQGCVLTIRTSITTLSYNAFWMHFAASRKLHRKKTSPEK